jgi:hypothetical protein
MKRFLLLFFCFGSIFSHAETTRTSHFYTEYLEAKAACEAFRVAEWGDDSPCAYDSNNWAFWQGAWYDSTLPMRLQNKNFHDFFHCKKGFYADGKKCLYRECPSPSTFNASNQLCEERCPIGSDPETCALPPPQPNCSTVTAHAEFGYRFNAAARDHNRCTTGHKGDFGGIQNEVAARFKG